MIIACPACSTRYVVPDSAIGLDGRTVRCAKCKHSWYQDGPETAVPERADTAAAVSSPASSPASSAASRTDDPRPHVGPSPTPVSTPAPYPAPVPGAVYDDLGGPDRDDRPDAPAFDDPASDEPRLNAPRFDAPRFDDGEAPSFDEGDAPYTELPPTAPGPAGLDEGVSQFDYAPPFRPRRNYLKLWTWAAVIFALLAMGTVVAVNTIGLPDWVPVSRPLFAMAEPDLEIAFPVEQQERRTLPNGTEFFGARIVVTNTARETRQVPPILIVLRDGRERIVYSWEVVPPQPSLAPGASTTINEAITDVPKSAVFADIGWAPR